MDREIVGVGRAIQKTFARAFLNSVGFYGCLQQIEGKKVIRVEQNVTNFCFRYKYFYTQTWNIVETL